ncbi:amino acid--tRNA ligase-related protein [Kitasatospora sp. NPDC058218]|uniref:amino acid--tRNA ligase-related protein n=1 Tax=Kitasatospora sp. NPDC058218 TaxID=3346385 RepID=UPI0036DF89F4
MPLTHPDVQHREQRPDDVPHQGADECRHGDRADIHRDVPHPDARSTAQVLQLADQLRPQRLPDGTGRAGRAPGPSAVRAVFCASTACGYLEALREGRSTETAPGFDNSRALLLRWGEARMSALSDPIRTEAHVLRSLRALLHDEGFTEVVTPVARRADLGPGRRASAGLHDGRYPRAMIGPALRVNVNTDLPQVYEIGPCFRPEPPDALHAAEFTMLDLYAAHLGFEDLIGLAWRLVGPHLPAYAPERLSIADHVREQFGGDLRTEPIGDLHPRMAARIGAAAGEPFRDVLGRYIARELEAATAGRAVFLTDYLAVLRTASPCDSTRHSRLLLRATVRRPTRRPCPSDGGIPAKPPTSGSTRH